MSKRILLIVSRAMDWVLSLFEMCMVALACVSLFAIMVLVFLDAMLRYLLNSPLGLTVEVVTLFLMSSALLSVLSYTLRQGGHISIDFFANMMNRRVYLVLIGLALLASTVSVGIMAWETSLFSYESWSLGEYTTGIHSWPLWLSKGLVAISFIGLTLRLLHCGVFNLLAGLLGDEVLAIPIMHSAVADPEGEGV